MVVSSPSRSRDPFPQSCSLPSHSPACTGAGIYSSARRRSLHLSMLNFECADSPVLQTVDSCLALDVVSLPVLCHLHSWWEHILSPPPAIWWRWETGHVPVRLLSYSLIARLQVENDLLWTAVLWAQEFSCVSTHPDHNFPIWIQEYCGRLLKTLLKST